CGIARERSVYLVNRRPGLPAGSTMAGIATSHAEALRQRFGTAVDVLGVSTGGSIALQLAVDHPQVVRRLLVVASAYRLPERARREQAELADRLASGRRALQLLANELATRTIARLALRGVLWLLAPRVQPKDPGDAIAVLRAEDGFDVGDRLPEITAPTIVIGGGRDAAYGVDMFRRTAEDIPDARLVLYPQRGHVGTLSDPRFTEDVRGFLR
ncbi:MAG: alpha/beta fold hydrolase, partial [Sciscionella sp.]